MKMKKVAAICAKQGAYYLFDEVEENGELIRQSSTMFMNRRSGWTVLETGKSRRRRWRRRRTRTR